MAGAARAENQESQGGSASPGQDYLTGISSTSSHWTPLEGNGGPQRQAGDVPGARESHSWLAHLDALAATWTERAHMI